MNETSCFDLNILSEVCKFVDRITMKLNTHRTAIDNNYFSKENSSFLFSYRTHHDYTSVPNTSYTVDAVYRYRIFGYGFFIITFAIFLIYWLSLTLWASFNVSYSGNSKYWVVLILLTNILGYSIFEDFLNKQREGIPLIN